MFKNSSCTTWLSKPFSNGLLQDVNMSKWNILSWNNFNSKSWIIALIKSHATDKYFVLFKYILLGYTYILTIAFKEPLKGFSGPYDGITELAVLPNGELVGYFSNKNLFVWNAKTGQVVQKVSLSERVSSFAVLPDGLVAILFLILKLKNIYLIQKKY